jgi:hypothetical protein
MSGRGSCRSRRDSCWSKKSWMTSPSARELEVLSTRETSLEHCEADLEWEQKALEDVVPRSWLASSTPIVGRPV